VCVCVCVYIYTYIYIYIGVVEATNLQQQTGYSDKFFVGFLTPLNSGIIL
jgi:hypothetical protein